MGESIKALGAITLFVSDPQVSKAFYQRAFGVTTVYEDENSAALELDNVVLNLLRRGAAVDELMGPLPVAEAAGASFELTVWVEDVDTLCAELADRGVEIADGPKDRAWGMRTAAFTDPDGYVWELAARIAR